MNKKFTKLLAAVMVIAMAVTVMVTGVSAQTGIAYDRKLTSGTNIFYWIDSSASSYASRISGAVQKLMYPSGMSNPMQLWQTTVNADSKMDFRAFNDPAADKADGYTLTFRRNGSGFSEMSESERDVYDWVYGEIYLNRSTFAIMTTTKQEAVIIHEEMHVYGAADTKTNPSSIMYNLHSQCTATGLTSDANTLLNNKY